MPTYREEVLADNPLAFWEFNESSGSPKDTVNGHVLTPNGGVLLGQAGPKGHKSVKFDGVDDHFVSTTFPDFMGNTNYTVEMWVKFPSQTMDYPTFIRRDGNSKTYIIRTRGPGAGTRVHVVETFVSGKTLDSAPTTFHNDAWHHVALITSQTDNNTYLFIDGTQYTGNQTGSVSFGGTGTAAALYIGRGSGTTEFYKGNIAALAIYPATVNGTRLRAHYNATDSPAYVEPVVEPFRGWGMPAR